MMHAEGPVSKETCYTDLDLCVLGKLCCMGVGRQFRMGGHLHTRDIFAEIC